jgi:3-hydroxyacyl-CoA dehydrogenase
MNFANVGIPVTIVERNQEALDKGLAVVRKNYERSASRGSIPPEAVEQRMALITGSTDKADFATCDIVIEAVFEDMELKQSIFRELDEICKTGALLASNTSALDVDKIAAVTSRPESVIGMHFESKHAGARARREQACSSARDRRPRRARRNLRFGMTGRSW